MNTAATIVIVLIFFIIYNSQNCDGAAMQAKLDELIRALDNTRGIFIGVEHLIDRQIAEIRTAEDDSSNEPDKYEGKEGTVRKSFDRLLTRS